ncbi:MAG: hypothetical protein IJ501_04585 [Bacilli bacterium]|nr:hypothetical protein [Bacilli bacterium]
MYELIIVNYINNLSKDDIVYFALKNNICLNDLELDYVYKTIKKNYKVLLSDNYQIIFNEGKNYLTSDNYQKICNLFMEYRNKFKSYLK